jgi:hypothetical protein
VAEITAADELAQLVHHWGEAYAITHPGRDRWVAQRRDGKDWLTAKTADELHHAIQADYRDRPVPRQASGQ